jgi:pyruvate dehydrogenase E2 component (dihydrolipoamide acetyltransferase)
VGMRTFKLPDLGEGLQEAEIAEWHVKVGDEVKVDQPIVSVETAKAVVEIPSPYAGKVEKLFGKQGDIIHLGEPLLGFEGEEADAGTVVGEMAVGKEVVDEAPVERGGNRGGGGAVKATPAVRALARRLNVELAMVTPSGPDGLILASDVQRVADILKEAGPVEPVRGVRRAMARNMALAHDEVVPASLYDDADIHAWAKGTDVTIRLVQSIVAACKAEPALNVWYDNNAGTRVLVQRVDIAIAVDTPDGLFVPVLRNCDKRDAADLRRGLDHMRRDVQSRTIPPEELRGGTITLSNFGMIAGRYAAPVVMPPTVAIIGAGRIHDRVVAANGSPAVHRMLPLSLTFDHRAVTGGEAGRFLAAMIKDLERA